MPLTDAQADLVSLYHLARTALDNPSRYGRMKWAAKWHSKEREGITEAEAFAELESALRSERV